MALMADSVVLFDDLSSMRIERLVTGASVTQEIFDELVEDNKTPYPNNFFACNILLDDRESVADGVLLDPSPPNGITEILCEDGFNSVIVDEATDDVDAELETRVGDETRTGGRRGGN